MKLKIAIYSFVLLLSMILLNNCTASMLWVPDTFKGYYQSVNTVLDDKTYLFFRVSAGGLTIYLGDDGTTNIKRTEYTSISPYNIIGLDYSYTFETGEMSGFINFNGNLGADIKITAYNTTFTISAYCNKVS